MVSPQTLSRQNKISFLQQIILISVELLVLDKKDLDPIDSRTLKKIVAILSNFRNQQKPTTKNVS